jgi:hypothetical protein
MIHNQLNLIIRDLVPQSPIDTGIPALSADRPEQVRHGLLGIIAD